PPGPGAGGTTRRPVGSGVGDLLLLVGLGVDEHREVTQRLGDLSEVPDVLGATGGTGALGVGAVLIDTLDRVVKLIGLCLELLGYLVDVVGGLASSLDVHSLVVHVGLSSCWWCLVGGGVLVLVRRVTARSVGDFRAVLGVGLVRG